jgi:hypothetical protein
MVQIYWRAAETRHTAAIARCVALEGHFKDISPQYAGGGYNDDIAIAKPCIFIYADDSISASEFRSSGLDWVVTRVPRMLAMDKAAREGF